MCFVFSTEGLSESQGKINVDRISFLQSNFPSSVTSSISISASKCKKCGNYLFPIKDDKNTNENEFDIVNSICTCPYCSPESTFLTEKTVQIGESRIARTTAYSFIFDQAYPMQFIKSQLEDLADSIDENDKVLIMGISDFLTVIYRSQSGLVEFHSFKDIETLQNIKNTAAQGVFLNTKAEIKASIIPSLQAYYNMNKRFARSDEASKVAANDGTTCQIDFILPIIASNILLKGEVFSIACFLRRDPCQITSGFAESLSLEITNGGYNFIHFCTVRGFKIVSAIAELTNGLVFSIKESDFSTESDFKAMRKIVKYSQQSRTKIISHAGSFDISEVTNGGKHRTEIKTKSQVATPVASMTFGVTTTPIMTVAKTSYSTNHLSIRNPQGVSGFLIPVKDSKFKFNPYVIEITDNTSGRYMTVHNIAETVNDRQKDVAWEVERKSLLGKYLSQLWSGTKINIEEAKEKIAEISTKHSVTKQTCLQSIGKVPDSDVLRFYYVFITNGIEECEHSNENNLPEISWF